MMEPMILQLIAMDLDEQRMISGYPIGGNIHLMIGDIYFPEEGWYDLVSADFENWLPKLISFARKHTDTCELGFMDGPCKAKFERKTSGAVQVVCLWNHQPQIPETEIDFPGFVESVCACLRKYNRILYENNFSAQFVDELNALRNLHF